MKHLQQKNYDRWLATPFLEVGIIRFRVFVDSIFVLKDSGFIYLQTC